MQKCQIAILYMAYKFRVSKIPHICNLKFFEIYNLSLCNLKYLKQITSALKNLAALWARAFWPCLDMPIVEQLCQFGVYYPLKIIFSSLQIFLQICMSTCRFSIKSPSSNARPVMYELYILKAAFVPFLLNFQRHIYQHSPIPISKGLEKGTILT